MFVQKLSADAKLPRRYSTFAASYDLCSSEDLIIPHGERGVVNTGIAIQMPIGSCGQIVPRSSLALRNGIDVSGGIIDTDYRGPLFVLLFNHSNTDFVITKNDRIAQLILHKICTPGVILVNDLNHNTSR